MINVKVSRPNQALVVPDAPGVAALFANAPLLPDGNRVVPHAIPEMLMLRHLGFKVPNPIDFYYDWCGGTPYAVQRATCRMLVENIRAYVLNHMGTGKTKTALWAWDYLNKCGFAKKLLVVAPLSTLNFVWAAECFRTLPGRRVEVLHGTRAERLERLSRDADIYVINHDGIKVVESELWTRADIDTLVLDELAVYRNNSDRSKKMRKFAARFGIVWGLTGAPMPNEPTDVWAQCMIVTPTRVPRYRNHAREMLMTNVNGGYIWKPKPDAVAKAFAWMQPSCRYALEDVVELPPVIHRMVDVPLSHEQEALYKKIATTMHAMIKDKEINALNAGAVMNKLLQVAGGWVYTQRPEFVRVDPSPRIVAMADMIKSAEAKVIVAIPYLHMLDGISRILNLKGVDIEHCVVHGGTKDRENIFNLFQNTEKYPVMLVHPKCIHHGLTLTRADMVIWYLPYPSLDVYDQFNARITRIGQTLKQQILHLQSTPIERKLYRMLREHQKMQNNFLELVEEATDEAVK